MKTQLTSIILPILLLTLAVSSRGAEPTDYPLAAPALLQPVPAEYADANRSFQGIPGIETDGRGGLWTTWYTRRAGDEPGAHVVLVAYSGDLGATWTEPILAVAPSGKVRAYDPTLWRDPSGRLWLFWAQSEYEGRSWWDGRAGVWGTYTKDPERGAGASWSEPTRFCDGIMLNKPTVDKRGRILMPTSIWDVAGWRASSLTHGAHVFVLDPVSLSASPLGKVEVPSELAACDEHMIVEKQDGSLWTWVRTLRGFGESFSSDGGKTWTELHVMDYPEHTVSRFFIRRLASGALLLVKHGALNDTGCGRCQLTAYLSTDDGATWSAGLMLDERGDVSYPDGCQDADGRIFVVWDREREGAKEILMARFREEDAAAGKFVSKDAATQIIVNKASGND